MSKFIFLIICVCSGILLHAQNISQQVTGRVEDEAVRSPLQNATLILRSNSESVVTITDSLGFFQFVNVTPGRYLLTTSFTGYQPARQEILVISARNTIVNITLKEWPSVLEEVEISARGNSLETGEQSITIEKTLRIPANFFDPVRAVTSYPGVVASSDQNNAIIVRGNSPANLLWRINGLDVVNPNHLSNAGTFTDKPATFGGGVNIISSQLLDRTDFYAGSMPSRYGNALSGVVDMNLREGSKKENHYTLQASLIGLDVAAEGPLGKDQNTSFLVNYRYSTVGLLSAMGVKFGDEDINFQDLTFSIDSRFSKERSLTVFGFFGASKNIFDHKETTEWEIDKDRYDINYDSKNFGTGVTFSQTLKQVNISSGVAFSGNDQKRNQHASPDILTGEPNVVYEDGYHAKKFLVSAFGRVIARVNSTQLESGIYVNYLKDKLDAKSQVGIDPTAQTLGSVEGVLLQPYAQWRIFLSEKWVAQTAMRYVYYSYNESGLLEPRVSLEYFPSAKNSLKFSYNLVSQLQ
ncbi:MAG TPA: TonB-dependent receptor, partial [Cyclobacteriaceae bacterium]